MKIKKKDLTGQRFGHLVVTDMVYGRRTKCVCVCDCGNTTVKTAEYVQRAKHPSCGCMTSHYRSIGNETDETGMKFGRLTVVDIIRDCKPTKAVCRCDCGNTITVAKADVVSGHTLSCGCMQAQRASKANTKDFSGYVSESGVRIISRAHRNRKGVWLWNCECPLCGRSFVALPAKVVENHTTSCGCKIQSSRERMIDTYLAASGVRYDRQKRFKDCRDTYTLPFDFAVYSDTGALKCLIEYDGEQHCRPVPFWGGKIGFDGTVRRDAIKTKYCADNKIDLLRISHSASIQEIKDQLANIIYP